MSLYGLECVGELVKIAHAIYTRYKELLDNNDLCKRILQHIEELQNFADDLEKLKEDEWPKSCTDKVQSLMESLETCKRTCEHLNSKHGLKKFVQVHIVKIELENLERQLERASSSLQRLLQLVSIVETKNLKEEVHRGNQEVKAAAIHPKDGIYLPNNCKYSGSRPHKIEHLKVTLDQSNGPDLMKVNWSDNKNPKGTIDRYEIEYDEKTLLEMPIEECRVRVDCNEFRAKIGPPKIIPGNLYTVRVRGINGEGPGNWSEEQIFRFKTGPPSKPKKPKIKVLSPTKVSITTTRPSKNEERGSAVTHCKVEYTPKMNGNDLTWNNLKFSIKQQKEPDVKFDIGSLIADTTYHFRIKMINDSGESASSDPVDVITTQFIPGPPHNLRISTKRTSTTIKLRWEKPTRNPQAALKYNVQMRRKKKHEWIHHATVYKKSAKITSLKTDTKYCFRVETVNNKGEAGVWSEIEAETRLGVFGRTVGTVGAVVGGTLGGPVLGAVGGGAISSRKKEGKAARVAGTGGAVAGALIGTVGAPIMGGLTGVAIYAEMSGLLNHVSPQTSDDEK